MTSADWRVLDLFSGACGGVSLGLERAGMETVALCEQDAWRRSRLRQNWPGLPVYRDARHVGERTTQALGRIDVVAGSPPCQDISAANAGGRGVDGERSGLFFEFTRVVAECRPRWVLAENVPRLRTRGADWVLAELEAAGYTCWPLVVGAGDVGAPHRRSRVWIVAHRPGDRCHARPSPAGWQAGRQPAGADARGAAHADCERRREGQEQSVGDAPSLARAVCAAPGAVADVLGAGLRQQPRRGCGPRGPAGAAELALDALPDRDGQPQLPEHGQVGGARALRALMASHGVTGTKALARIYGWMMGYPPGWLDDR